VSITAAEVMAAAEAAVASNPQGTNPMNDDGCLNRAEEDDAPTPRCIASQIHFDLTGRELTGDNYEPIGVCLNQTYPLGDSPFDGGAKDLLRAMQRTFDTKSQRGGTWSEALAEFKEQTFL